MKKKLSASVLAILLATGSSVLAVTYCWGPPVGLRYAPASLRSPGPTAKTNETPHKGDILS